MTATANLTIGGRRTSVNADSVTIHRVSADNVTVRDIPGGDYTTDFTSIDIDNDGPRQSNLFIHGTPGQRAIELLRIAHLLAEAAEALQEQNAAAISTDTDNTEED